MRFDVGRDLDPLYLANSVWTRVIHHADGVAPHSVTQRFNIAPSDGTVYVVRHVYALVLRGTAPGTAGVAQAYVAYSPDGVNEVMIALAMLLSSTAGAMDRVVLPVSLPVRYPGYVRGYTSDGSTGGTCHYRLGALYQTG